MLGSLPGATPHNWIRSVGSRARQTASTIKPCPARTSTGRMQVNVEQSRWNGRPATAARRSSSSPIEDEKMLNHISRPLLWKYIREAPPSAHEYFNGIENNRHCPNCTADPAWLKVHLPPPRGGSWRSAARPDVSAARDHRSMLAPTGGRGPRPVGLLGLHSREARRRRSRGVPQPGVPWILGVHAFSIMWHYAPGDACTCLPAGTPPGSYIAYYMWAGYRDCVDIDVLPDEMKSSVRPGGPTAIRRRAAAVPQDRPLPVRRRHVRHHRV